MLVDTPGGGAGAIFIRDGTGEVLLTQDKISNDAAALALAAHMAHPSQVCALPVLLLGKTVLAIGESAVSHIHTVVAYLFGIGNLVVIHAHFPIPVGAVHGLHGLLVKMQAPVKTVGETAGGVPVFAVPLDAHSHGVAVRFLGGEALAVFAARLASHHGTGAGKHREVGVAGTVGEQASADPDTVLACCLNGLHRLDGSALHLHLVNRVAGEECDVGLGGNNVPLLPVLIVMRAAGIAVAVGADLVKYVSQRRIRRHVDLAAKTHPDLGTVVSAKYISVLEQGYAASVAGCGYGSAQA